MAGSDGRARELLADVSHELRTPLNAILGFAELLRDGRLGAVDARQQEYLGAIHDSARRLLCLIDDVLALSRDDAGSLTLDPKPVVLPELIEETCELVRTPVMRRDACLAVECEPGLRELILDAQKLKRVLYDYLATALSLAGDPARVTIRARSAGPDRFRLEVEASGPGVAPAALADLRADPAGADGRLAVARRIVAAHGGIATAAGTAEGGALLVAELPRQAPPR